MRSCYRCTSSAFVGPAGAPRVPGGYAAVGVAKRRLATEALASLLSDILQQLVYVSVIAAYILARGYQEMRGV